MAREYKRRTCEHPGCDNYPIICRVTNGRNEEIELLCPEHAFEHGYCSICGEFWAGIESFDFGPGYCDNCRDEIRADEGEFDEHPDDHAGDDLPDEAYQEAAF